MPRLTEGTKGKVGPANPGAWRKAARKLNANERKPIQSPGQVYDSFIARITGNTALSGSTTRWRYQWEECLVKDDYTVTKSTDAAPVKGLRASRSDAGTLGEWTHAINLCEMCQAGASPTTIGPGVTISGIPSGFSVKPIATNTVVIMHALQRKSGKVLYAFSMPNAIDGTCS